MTTDAAREAAYRYVYKRDEGHTEFTKKARKCEDFFAGIQWDKADLANLAASRRPALTINKILNTVSNVVGEQLFNRSAVAYRPAKSGTSEVADALTKVFMQISQNNRLPWTRTNVYLDGLITGRGYYDVRLDFDDSMMGEARVTCVSPTSVLLDPDAHQYDTNDWSDVTVSRWITLDTVEMLYGKKYRDELEGRPEDYSPYDFMDGSDWSTDRFGNSTDITGMRSAGYYNNAMNTSLRKVRILDRQYRELAVLEYFVDLSTGDMREIPQTWSRERRVDFLQKNPTLGTIKKKGFKICWSVTSGDVVMHEKPSPFKHFTIVPYFPHFRRGRTIGLVENLIGPQELLNKSRSQELHILNTTANSGWKVKQGTMKNMADEDLREQGAETGFVAVVADMDGLEKITPNQIPTGLDRVGMKAEDDIKNISGVSDYQTGFAREDVAAKAIKYNQARSSTNIAPILDNLNRSDTMLAERILDIVQRFYTEPRLIHITGMNMGAKDEQVMINEITPEGEILRDLTIGEYAVVVTSEPERDNYEDTQFDQAVRLRTELGVQIPDSVIIESSKLRNKQEILAIMQGSKSPEQQQFEEELARRNSVADLLLKEAQAKNEDADANLKAVKAGKESIEAQQAAIENKSDISPETMMEMKLEAYKIALEGAETRRTETMKHIQKMQQLKLQAANKPKVAAKGAK
jgi:hypothetical protein